MPHPSTQLMFAKGSVPTPQAPEGRDSVVTPVPNGRREGRFVISDRSEPANRNPIRETDQADGDQDIRPIARDPFQDGHT